MSWQNRRNMDAAIAAAPAPSRPPKHSLKRYTWSRLHGDLLTSTLWPLVARRAGVALPLVEAFVMRLEAHANAATPRGFVGDFNVAALAATWNFEEEALARIFVLLEDPEVGWIDQDHVVSFWSRNPDEDGEEAERKRELDRIRQQRKRDRAKENRAAMRARTTYPPSRDVTRDSVTVTPRADQITTKDAGVTLPGVVGLAGQGTENSAFHTECGDIGDFGRANLWLRSDGEKLVTERMRVLRSRASQLIERWCAEAGDLVALVRFLRGAIAANVVADQFAALVDEQIVRHRSGVEQLSLPLAPVIVRRSAS